MHRTVLESQRIIWFIVVILLRLRNPALNLCLLTFGISKIVNSLVFFLSLGIVSIDIKQWLNGIDKFRTKVTYEIKPGLGLSWGEY